MGACGTPIELLKLSPRAYNRLREAGLLTAEEVRQLSPKALMGLPKMGLKTYNEIRAVIGGADLKEVLSYSAEREAHLEMRCLKLEALLDAAGVPWRSGKNTLARDADVFSDRLAGWSLAAIGTKHNISPQRIQQILARVITRMRNAAKEIDP